MCFHVHYAWITDTACIIQLLLLTFNIFTVLPRGTDVVFGLWEHSMPSHNVCSVPAWPSPPHPFITRQELINEADFQRSSAAQTVQLCIFGIFLYHVLVARWARQSSHMWEARGGNEPRWHELYLPESWPLPLLQIKAEWLVRHCQSALSSSRWCWQDSVHIQS